MGLIFCNKWFVPFCLTMSEFFFLALSIWLIFCVDICLVNLVWTIFHQRGPILHVEWFVPFRCLEWIYLDNQLSKAYKVWSLNQLNYISNPNILWGYSPMLELRKLCLWLGGLIVSIWYNNMQVEVGTNEWDWNSTMNGLSHFVWPCKNSSFQPCLFGNILCRYFLGWMNVDHFSWKGTNFTCWMICTV